MLLVSVDPSAMAVNSLSFLTSSVSRSVELLHSPTPHQEKHTHTHQSCVHVQIRRCVHTVCEYELISSTFTVRQQRFQHTDVPAHEGVDVGKTDGHFSCRRDLQPQIRAQVQAHGQRKLLKNVNRKSAINKPITWARATNPESSDTHTHTKKLVFSH